MHTHANLQPFNTFGIQAQAAQLAEAHSVDEMRALIDAHGTPDLVLGGGSNVLLRGDVDGFVLVNRIPENSSTNHMGKSMVPDPKV